MIQGRGPRAADPTGPRPAPTPGPRRGGAEWWPISSSLFYNIPRFFLYLTLQHRPGEIRRVPEPAPTPKRRPRGGLPLA